MGMYVVSHKELKNKFPKGYKTIIVNANYNDVKGDLYDNVGDNISEKNRSFCELTAIYWLWKNSTDDYIGIDHYRRFFVDGESLLPVDKAKRIVENGFVIVPQKETFTKKMGTLYWSTSGYKHDLTVVRNSIIKIAPEYLKDFDYFLKQNSMYCYNMSVMKRDMFDNYCEWLFAILEDTEQSLDMEQKGAESRRSYYKRIYGFIAERLLNVFLIHNNIEVKELPIKFTGKKPSLALRTKNKLNKIKDKYIG